MRKLSAFMLAVLILASFGSVAMAQPQPAAGDTAAAPATTDMDRDDDGADWGWLGLLGLAGLMGLKRREPTTVRTTHTGTGATTNR